MEEIFTFCNLSNCFACSRLKNTWTQALRSVVQENSWCMAAEVTQWHLRQPVASNPVVFFGVLALLFAWFLVHFCVSMYI